MKKLFVLSLIAVFTVGLLSFGALSVSSSTNTKVKWKFGDDECSVNLKVHSNLNRYLNTPQTLSPGEFLKWDTAAGFSEESLQVITESSCRGGYTLSVHASDVKTVTNQAGQNIDILDSFSFKSQVTDSQLSQGDYDVTVSDWTSMPGPGGSQEVGIVKGKDLDGRLNQVNGTTWLMNYRYMMEEEDALNEKYEIELTYTVSKGYTE